MLNELKFTYKH